MDEPARGQDAPQTPTTGSPAGEPLPGDKPSTTTGPTPQAVQQWQEAAPGRSASPAVPSQAERPTGVGASSRDTPPPSGEGATTMDPQAPSAPGDTRPPRPVAARGPMPASAHAPAAKVHAPAAPDEEALVEAITRRLADNLAKALRQSVVEAVQAQSGRAAPDPASPDE